MKKHTYKENAWRFSQTTQGSREAAYRTAQHVLWRLHLVARSAQQTLQSLDRVVTFCHALRLGPWPREAPVLDTVNFLVITTTCGGRLRGAQGESMAERGVSAMDICRFAWPSLVDNRVLAPCGHPAAVSVPLALIQKTRLLHGVIRPPASSITHHGCTGIDPSGSTLATTRVAGKRGHQLSKS